MGPRVLPATNSRCPISLILSAASYLAKLQCTAHFLDLSTTFRVHVSQKFHFSSATRILAMRTIGWTNVPPPSLRLCFSAVQ